MSKLKFDAVIFDLDGVITSTASLHSIAWKQMFDEYLHRRESRDGEIFREFTHEKDYLPFVDGKPRYKGVQSFLESRNIKIPFGNPSDSATTETVCGLGNRKNEIFLESVDKGEFDVFESTALLLDKLKQLGIHIGVASSSKNCKRILESVNLLPYFETRVDGVVSAELGLKGKPEPDIFTNACDNLGVPYDRSIIVEDAVSGVQAGRNGNFGLVIGVARENNKYDLEKNGADIVVTDLEEINIPILEKWFTEDLEEELWSLKYYGYAEDKKEESKREVLLATGNGFFVTRGSMEEFGYMHTSYPGTYIGGVYNKLASEVDGQVVTNEDLVNCPSWINITFKLGNGSFFSLDDFKIDQLIRRLDFRNGILHKNMKIEDPYKNKIDIESKRIVSMDNPHLAGLKYTITSQNYSGKFVAITAIDGLVINEGVERYRLLNSKHLNPIKEYAEDNVEYLIVETNQSKIKIIIFTKIILRFNGKLIQNQPINYIKPGCINSEYYFDLNPGDNLEIVKLVSIFTNYGDKSCSDKDLLEKAQETVMKINSFDRLLEDSKKKWETVWKLIDIQIEGDRIVQKLLRLHMYHLIITSSKHSVDLDISIPARGLHGEAYRGHIFWDTIFILPFYNLTYPEISKNVLMYRYRRLETAKEIARQNNNKGAIYPWQSGRSGEEETQKLHLNPRSGKWNLDHSYLQRHVSLAVAYNIWQYFWFTEDKEFLKTFGAELFLEICKFWADVASVNEMGKYNIKGVMGPDEFHETLPGNAELGLEDNFYTNIMVGWLLKKASQILSYLPNSEKLKLFKKINLTKEDLNHWEIVRRNLNIIQSDSGIFAQFKGYFDLEELDWEHYKQKFGNIQRMDRILRAENKSADYFKVSKQPDVLMAFYLLDNHHIGELLQEMNLNVSKSILKYNFNYYYNRTSHGSTLSKIVHSHLLNSIKKSKEAYKLYVEAIQSDFLDIQGGTTGEGIHVGVMASTINEIYQSFLNINFTSEIITISPKLPTHWRKLACNFRFKDIRYFLTIEKNLLCVKIQSQRTEETKIKVEDEIFTINLKKQEELLVALKKSDDHHDR